MVDKWTIIICFVTITSKLILISSFLFNRFEILGNLFFLNNLHVLNKKKPDKTMRGFWDSFTYVPFIHQAKENKIRFNNFHYSFLHD